MSSETPFVLVDIGCIECGEDSRVVGLYESALVAESAWHLYRCETDKWGRPEWHGQHHHLVADLRTVVNP